MDAFLQDNLPYALNLYNQYYAPYSSYLAPLRAALLHYQSLYFRFIYPSVYPFYQLSAYIVRQILSNVANTSPASASTETLVSFLALIFLFFVSLKILNFVRRQVMWWVGLVTTVVSWAAVGFGAWYVYNRGVEGSIDDVAYLAGLLMGWTQEGNTKGGRLASEREWDAERMRRRSEGRSPGRRARGGGW